jgi:hypothetical protein
MSLEGLRGVQVYPHLLHFNSVFITQAHYYDYEYGSMPIFRLYLALRYVLNLENIGLPVCSDSRTVVLWYALTLNALSHSSARLFPRKPNWA